MGYAWNVAFSIPMAIILYMLSDKMIFNIIKDNIYNERMQKGFIISFLIGLIYCVIGMTILNDTSHIHNKSLQLALYGSGAFLIVNTIIFNWDCHDETTKGIILGIAIIGFVIYTYSNRI